MNEFRDNKLNTKESTKSEKLKKSWTLREIVLEKPISSSESERMKTLRWEVDNNLIIMKKNLNNLRYWFPLDAVKAVKGAGIDASVIEKEMPKLQEKILRHEVNKDLIDTKKNFYIILSNCIKAAKGTGIDVSFLEKEMPKLQEKILSHKMDKDLIDIIISIYDTLDYRIKAAKTTGIDVSDVEKEMPKFQKEILREKLDVSLRKIRSDVRLLKNDYLFNTILYEVKSAKAAGVDISDIEKELFRKYGVSKNDIQSAKPIKIDHNASDYNEQDLLL